MNKNLKFLVKIFVSFFILYLVVSGLEIKKIKDSFFGFNFYILVFAFVLIGFSLLLMTLKLKIFTDKIERKKFFVLYMIYWASDFMGLFNLGSAGSELYKMFSFKNKKKALGFSLIDKAYSFLWYILFFLAIILVFGLFGSFNIFNFFLSVIIYFVFVFSYVLLEKRVLRYSFFKKKIISLGFRSGLSKEKLFMHSLLALLFNLNLFIVYSLVLSSYGIEFNLMLFAFLSALIIFTTLPISFQGLGVREFILLNYARFMGFNQELILSGSFMIFLIFLIFRILGVVPFLTLKK